MKTALLQLWSALARLTVESERRKPQAAMPVLDVRQRKSGDLDDAELARIALNLLAQTQADADEAKKRAFSLLTFSTAVSGFLFGVAKDPLKTLSPAEYSWAMGLIVVVLVLCAKCAYHCLQAVSARQVVRINADLSSTWYHQNRAATLVAECAYAYQFVELARAARTEHANFGQRLVTYQTFVALTTVGLMTWWSPREDVGVPDDYLSASPAASAPPELGTPHPPIIIDASTTGASPDAAATGD